MWTFHLKNLSRCIAEYFTVDILSTKGQMQLFTLLLHETLCVILIYKI